MGSIRVKFKHKNPANLTIKAKREARDAINEFLYEAIAVFVKEAAVNVVIDTGMTISSLRPLAIKVGTDINFYAMREPYSPLTTLRGEIRKSRSVSPEEGYKAGLKAAKIKKATLKDLSVNFSYSIKVFQWTKYEPEWDALNAGLEKMREYIKANKFWLELTIGKILQRTFKNVI
jgi:hypothetical protein